MDHQLDAFTIHAFRQLKNLTLPTLGRVNLLIGANNSGKTSVLEAIALHCRPIEPLHWLNIAQQRGFKSSPESAFEAFRWLFHQNTADADDPFYHGGIHLEGCGRYPNVETLADFQGFVAGTGSSEGSDAPDNQDVSSTSSFTTTTTPPPSFSERGADIILSARPAKDRSLEFEAGTDGFRDEQFRLWESEPFVRQTTSSNLQLPVAMISPFAHRVERLQNRQLTDAVMKDRQFSLLEAIQLMDPEITDLVVLSRTGVWATLYVRHRLTGFTPLTAMGDGIRRVLTFALTVGQVQDGALLIDEIETAIHKDALTNVFEWLVRACRFFNVQLFATTHSLEAIDAMLAAQIDEPAEIVAFHLPQRGEGTVKRFEGEILDNLRFDRGLDIR